MFTYAPILASLALLPASFWDKTLPSMSAYLGSGNLFAFLLKKILIFYRPIKILDHGRINYFILFNYWSLSC